MKLPRAFDFGLMRASTVVAGALSLLSLQAASVSWDGGGADTNWLTLGNWSADQLPAPSDAVTIGSSYSVNYNRGDSTLNLFSLTLDSGAVLASSDVRSGVLQFTNFNNAGTLRYNGTGAGIMRLEIVPGGTYVNTGLIESIGNGGTMQFNAATNNATLVNTGGTIAAKTGGIINLTGTYDATNPGLKIVGGTVATDLTSTLRVQVNANIANAKTTFENVTITNAGNYTIENAGTLSNNDRFAWANLIGTTALTNTGTVSVLNSSTANPASNTAVFTLSGSASFDNQGTLNVRNSATGATANRTAKFEITSGSATFTNTGSINVTNAVSTGTGMSSALFTSAKSLTSSGNITVTGNANNAGAKFEVTGAGNRFTQTAGVFLLASGGELAAPTVNIDGGALRGSGKVTGDLNIASGAILSPGDGSIGTLAVFGNVGLGGTYTVDLNGASFADRLNVTGVLDFSQATLSLNALTGGSLTTGSFTIASYSNLTGAGFLSVINNTGFAYSIDYAGGAGKDIVVTLSTIPEPSTFAILLGGGCLLIAFFRRRA